MKQTLRTASILLLVLAGNAEASAETGGRYEVLSRERALLNDLSPYLDRVLQDDDLAELTRLLDSPDQAVGILAAGLLFKNRPAEFRDVVFERFAVRDYGRRDPGQYTLFPQEDLPGMIEALENGQPSLADRRLDLLVVFLHFRDSNEWIVNGDQRIALARVFRTAFLTSILAGTKIDPLETANAIDRDTRAVMGF